MVVCVAILMRLLDGIETYLREVKTKPCPSELQDLRPFSKSSIVGISYRLTG